MPIQGPHDHFELKYMNKLKTMLADVGIPICYEQDRAALDVGLHLFVEGPGNNYEASRARVWFQAKGIHADTLTADQFDAASTVTVSGLKMEHLRYWFAAPEPAYLVVYVEAADTFLAEDVRDIVNRMWPHGDFYAAPPGQASVTVNIEKSSILDRSMFMNMLRHRSMRVDGATFQGRPLGHRFDPLRSELAIDGDELWDKVVQRLLHEYCFKTIGPVQWLTTDLQVMRGQLYDTMVWQSSAFGQFGYDAGTDFRSDPAVESVQGDLVVIIDHLPGRDPLTAHEQNLLTQALSDTSTPILLFFHSKISAAQGERGVHIFESLKGPGVSA